MSRLQNNPQTITLMVAGAITAVGFAVWNANRSFSPPAEVAPRPALDGATNAAGNPAPSVSPSVEAATPAASQVAVTGDTRSRVSEAMLAPGSDPFFVVPTKEVTPKTATSPFATAQKAAAQGQVPPYAVLPGMKSEADSSSIPIIGTSGVVLAPLPITLVEPELVGTLLGASPCAVFRTDNNLVAVPVGEVFRGWKIVRVRHGEAEIKGMGRTLRLIIGMSTASGAIERPATRPEQNDRRTPSLPLQSDGTSVAATDRIANGVEIDPPSSNLAAMPDGSPDAPSTFRDITTSDDSKDASETARVSPAGIGVTHDSGEAPQQDNMRPSLVHAEALAPSLLSELPVSVPDTETGSAPRPAGQVLALTSAPKSKSAPTRHRRIRHSRRSYSHRPPARPRLVRHTSHFRNPQRK